MLGCVRAGKEIMWIRWPAPSITRTVVSDEIAVALAQEKASLPVYADYQG
jgi:hypothetical protein